MKVLVIEEEGGETGVVILSIGRGGRDFEYEYIEEGKLIA
jgi:YD repeat-containing protein